MGTRADAAEVVDATRRLAGALERRLDASLEGLAITYAQLELLERIAGDRDAHAAELARKLGCSRQAISSLLARLSLGDLVELSPLDHGVRVPSITDQGRRRAHHGSSALRRTFERIEVLPVEERLGFVRAAAALREIVEASDRRIR